MAKTRAWRSSSLHRFNQDVPEGYGFDYVNREALLKLLSVRGGKLVTPSGMVYNALYLPSHVNRLSLPAARKLRDLVSAGAVLVAPRPVGGLGLNDIDSEIEKIAQQVWGSASTGNPHSFGKGRVYASPDLSAVLKKERLLPDVEVTGAGANSKILRLHRSAPGREIYFLSNQSSRAEVLNVRFRAHGMAPELWHADTGVRELLSFESNTTALNAPLTLAPHEAVFVVLGRSALAKRSVSHQELPLMTLDEPWSVIFQPGLGAPASATFSSLTPWNESPDNGIRYFSGHATYHQQITLPASFAAAGDHIMLNLGEVRELASVSVNGTPPSITWHAPYKVDVTGTLHPGRNDIAITVVNLWPNRLIGDKQKGASTYTYAPQSPYSASSPLLRSGLLGPITLTRLTTEQR